MYCCFIWSVLSDLWGRPADEGGDLCGACRRTSGWPRLQWTGKTSFCTDLPQTCLSHTHHLACDWLWTGRQQGATTNTFLSPLSRRCLPSPVLFPQCSRSCGGGVRERRVSCFDTDLNPYPESRCGAASKPVSVESCNSQPCNRAQSESNLDHICTFFWVEYLCMFVF